MPTLEDALALAAAGWSILPLRGKVPLTSHGVKDATTDADTVRGWWRDDRSHNVGARVPADVVVLDFDPQNGGSVALLEDAAHVRLPDTLTVRSGRGGGSQHRYYRRPTGALSSTRLPDGIDVKTDRGYCVMPPSVHPVTDQPYTWEPRPIVPLPPAVLELLRPAQAEPRRQAARPQGMQKPDEFAGRAAYLARHVEQLTEGNRNAGLFWAACRAAQDGHPAETFDLLEGAALVAGLTELEAQRTIASAMRTEGRR